LESEQSLIADGNAMCVASEIFEHLLGTAEGRIRQCFDLPLEDEQLAFERFEQRIEQQGPEPAAERANLVLDELDRELERRGPPFCSVCGR